VGNLTTPGDQTPEVIATKLGVTVGDPILTSKYGSYASQHMHKISLFVTFFSRHSNVIVPAFTLI